LQDKHILARILERLVHESLSAKEYAKSGSATKKVPSLVPTDKLEGDGSVKSANVDPREEEKEVPPPEYLLDLTPDVIKDLEHMAKSVNETNYTLIAR